MQQRGRRRSTATGRSYLVSRRGWLLSLIFLVLAQAAVAVTDDELLRPEQAFVLTSEQHGNGLRLTYEIAEGYFLYRQRFRFRSDSEAIELGTPDFPPGKKKNDEFFGEVETYRGKLAFTLPVGFTGRTQQSIEVISQGCADIGICFPPYTHKLSKLGYSNAAP